MIDSTLTMAQIAKLDDYGLLQVAGGDARAFLHAQLTNDIEHLAADRARYAGWCTAKGRLLATFLVLPRADDFLLQVARDLAPGVARRLSMFVLRAKVKLAEASAEWTQYGLWGPQADPFLERLGLSVPRHPFGLGAARDSIAVRIEDARYLLLAAPSLQAAIEPNAPAGDWALAEIRAGRPLIAQATQDQFVPQMVNLELAGGVDFHKGCYPGQEIVARAQYRGVVKRRMVRLRGAGLAPGQDLYSDDAPGQPSGTVVNAAADESLAVLQSSSIESGSPIRARPDGAALERLPLPYA